MNLILWLKQTRCNHPVYRIQKIDGEYYNTCKACEKPKPKEVKHEQRRSSRIIKKLPKL